MPTVFAVSTPKGYQGTSNTSTTIATGTKTFTVAADLAYSPGARVRTSSNGLPNDWMEGTVTSYSGTTLVVSMDSVHAPDGVGPYSDWNINVAGTPGTNGTNGATGATGPPGATGPAGPQGPTDLNYVGSYTPGTYNDGDIVVGTDGIVYMCIKTGVTTSPDTWPPGPGATTVYDLVCSLVGKPSAGATVFLYTATRPVAFPANFLGSKGTVGANPAATASYNVLKNGSSIGTVSISTAGVFTFTSTGGTAQSLVVGDRFTITAPGTQDSTLSDVAFTLSGTRT